MRPAGSTSVEGSMVQTLSASCRTTRLRPILVCAQHSACTALPMSRARTDVLRMDLLVRIVCGRPQQYAGVKDGALVRGQRPEQRLLLLGECDLVEAWQGRVVPSCQRTCQKEAVLQPHRAPGDDACGCSSPPSSPGSMLGAGRLGELSPPKWRGGPAMDS